MDRHGIFAAVGVLLPDRFIDGPGGIDLAGIFHQELENFIFDGGQADLISVHRHGLRPVVQNDAADGDGAAVLHGLGTQPVIPAQVAPDPGQDLHGHEGLGDVVIGPHIQAQDLVLGLGFGGEQQNGHIGKLPDPGGGGDAVHIGHHHIQQHQMDVPAFDDFQSLGSVLRLKKAIPLRGQVNFQCIDNFRLIVADQNVVHQNHLLCVHIIAHSFLR